MRTGHGLPILECPLHGLLHGHVSTDDQSMDYSVEYHGPPSISSSCPWSSSWTAVDCRGLLQENMK